MFNTGSRWQTVVVWFVATRLVIYGLGVVGVGTFVNQRSGAVTDTMAALNPERAWHQWDSLWYEQVARHGYSYSEDPIRNAAAAGFFPLYPLTVRLVMAATGTASFFWPAAMLSNLLALAALLLLATRLATSSDQARHVVTIVLASAGSFYLSIPYAESLFLLLVVATMVLSRNGKYELAGLVAGLAATARVHGLALVAVPVLACWLDSRNSQSRVIRVPAVLALFAVPVFVYLAYLASVQGSWMAFVSRQELWDNPSPYPFQAIAGFFHFPNRLTGWLHGGFWFLYLGLLLRHWRRMPLGEVLFCAGVFLISTQQEAFHGIYRYMVPLIPLAFALSDDQPRVRHFFMAVNLVFGVLMLLAFVTHNRITV